MVIFCYCNESDIYIRQLPQKFISAIPSIVDADLLIIIGTSLTVHPFASLAGMADRQSCPRVLINIERVGDLGSRRDDVVLLGKCDDVVRDLCKELGWSEELEKLWAETQRDEDKGEEEKKGEEETDKGDKEAFGKDVEHLAAAIAARLDLLEAEEAGEAVSKERPDRRAEQSKPEGGEEPKIQQGASQKHDEAPGSGSASPTDVTRGPYYKDGKKESYIPETRLTDSLIDDKEKL